MKIIETIVPICNYKPLIIVMSKLWIKKTRIIVILKLQIIATQIMLTKTTKTSEFSGKQIAECSYPSAKFSDKIFCIMVTPISRCFLLVISLHYR